MRLSWTQLDMWEGCPYSWYAKYVMKAVPWGTNIHFSVGSATHSAIENALRVWDKPKRTPTEMTADYTKYLENDGVVDKDDPDQVAYWRLVGQNMLMGWHQWVLGLKDFQVESIPERRVKKDNFLGVIDCVAVIDGQRYIIDWKTSGSPYDQERTDKDGQLTAYMWIDGCHYDTKVAHGVLIKGSQRFQFLESTRSEEDVESFLKRVRMMREVAGTYKNLKDPEKKKSKGCNRCDAYVVGVCEGQDDF